LPFEISPVPESNTLPERLSKLARDMTLIQEMKYDDASFPRQVHFSKSWWLSGCPGRSSLTDGKPASRGFVEENQLICF
jgi:hypothetical protein